MRVAKLAEQNRQMVAEAGLKAWKQLPAHTRAWISPEDLIEDGMEWMVTKLVPKWRLKRGCFSTFLHNAIWRYFDDQYVKRYRVQQRDEGRLVALDEVTYLPSDETAVEHILRECWVVPLVLRVYKQASAELQEELVRWFITGERIHTAKQRFVVAREEFRKLAGQEGLQVQDCSHLFRSPECREKLEKALWYEFI